MSDVAFTRIGVNDNGMTCLRRILQRLAPMTIAPRIWEATSTMADRMAYWAEIGWRIETEGHLNQYTFSVAGSVGLLLSDLWSWHDGR